MKTIAIAIPCNWPWLPTAFFASGVQMFSAAQSEYNVTLLMSNSTLIDVMRETLAGEALKAGADYIMWLDADQVYPPDTILKLAHHCEEGKLIVGGVTPHKNNGRPMAYTFGNNYGACVQAKEFELNRGLVQVDAMGFGGVMTAKEVFDTIPYPRFYKTWDYANNHAVGEDFCFYARCKEKGIDVWCDTDLVFQHLVTYAVQVNDPAFPDGKTRLGLSKV